MALDKTYQAYRDLGLGGKRGISENFIPGIGPIPAPIMFIGEAPGMIEDKFGVPFSGPAGKVLDQLLELIAFTREQVFLTNVFKYRPPRNRDPLPAEIRDSLKCLTAEIKIVNPRIIVPMGRIAMDIFVPNKSISKLHGSRIRRGSRVVIPTFHPAAPLHPNADPKVLKYLQNDFKSIRRVYDMEV